MSVLSEFFYSIYSSIRKFLYIYKIRREQNCSIHGNVDLKGIENIHLGQNIGIGYGSILNTTRGGKIKIGNNSGFGPYTYVDTWGGNIVIGENTTIDSFGVLYGHGGLSIGNNVLIATSVIIVPAQHRFDSLETPIRYQGLICKGIVIEDDVWVGAGVKILDGIRIGKGAIIGAGSVVTSDIAPYSVVVGIPARVIKKRSKIGL